MPYNDDWLNYQGAIGVIDWKNVAFYNCAVVEKSEKQPVNDNAQVENDSMIQIRDNKITFDTNVQEKSQQLIDFIRIVERYGLDRKSEDNIISMKLLIEMYHILKEIINGSDIKDEELRMSAQNAIADVDDLLFS